MLNEFSPQIPVKQPAISVSELNRQARTLLERSFLTILVEGEISNFVRPSSGHWYFTLKDSKAQVRCAMFKNRNFQIRNQPQNGDRVIVKAKVSLYEGRGEYQLICEHLESAGSGALQVAFEELKLKLQKEGLFDTGHKKPLPKQPRHLGIVTSATGAAVHDILTVLKRRFPGLPVTIYPTAVQGEDAPEQICRSIILAEAHQECDVLIVGRGGGSLEDLWAFNDERVARTLFDCEIPVISAVGHEVDVVISDFIADVRAPTPSAAAELISPDQHQLKLRVKQLEERLLRCIKQRIDRSETQVSHLKNRLRHPGQKLREQAQQLDNLELRLQKSINHNLFLKSQKYTDLSNRLKAQSPAQLLERQKERSTNLHARLTQATLTLMKQNKLKLEALMHQLNTVSPLATLERGYAIVKGPQGNVLLDASEVAEGDQVETQLRQGRIQSRIEKIITD
ncbi:MAG: exodeoxyribonuclease VII large subunit [Neptuniibacter sp.]